MNSNTPIDLDADWVLGSDSEQSGPFFPDPSIKFTPIEHLPVHQNEIHRDSGNHFPLLQELQDYPDCPGVSIKECPSGHGYSYSTTYCRRSDCSNPKCQEARMQRILSALDTIAPPSTHSCYMLTLSWPNVSCLDVTLKSNWKTWYKWSLTLMKRLQTEYYCRFTEVTFNLKAGNYNPHFHCLVWLDGYLEYSNLIKIWHEVTGISNAHIHAAPVHTQGSLIRYFAKYASKVHTTKNPKVWLKNQRTFYISRKMPRQEKFLIGFTSNLLCRREFDVPLGFGLFDALNTRVLEVSSGCDSFGPIIETIPGNWATPEVRYYQKHTISFKRKVKSKTHTLCKCPWCSKFLHLNWKADLRDEIECSETLTTALNQTETRWFVVSSETYFEVLNAVRSGSSKILELHELFKEKV